MSLGTYGKKVLENESLAAEKGMLQAEMAQLRADNNLKIEKMSDIRNTYEEFIDELKEDMALGKVGIRSTDYSLTLSLGNAILFKSGYAELHANGKRVLGSIAKVLKNVENKTIHVEGHSDDQEISGTLKLKYPSNWELSSARSGAVVRYLIHSGVDPSTVILVAFSKYQPVADNSTPEGRMKNRRVEISLYETTFLVQ